jgi:two-component system cell cycle sensor histidine kinase/response regulator CckA
VTERIAGRGRLKDRKPAPELEAKRPPDAIASGALLEEVERIAQLGGFVWTRGVDTPHWTEELFRLLGYDPARVTPSIDAFFAAVHPEDVEKVKAAWAEAREGALGGAEYRIIRHDTSEVRYMRSTGQPFLNQGRVDRIIGAVQDITEAKRNAVALEEAKAAASVTQRVAGIGSFVLRVDPLAPAWTQEPRPVIDTAQGHPSHLGQVDQVHPEDREKHARWWGRLAHEDVPEPLCVRLVLPDGSTRHLQTQAARVRLADGLERVMGTTVDVTERVELEEQLRHAAKMEAIGQLAAGVAHDFNNYLMVLDQSLSMLSDCDGQDRDELIASGRLALARSRDLTRQLLAFARRQPFNAESVELAEVVRRFYDLLSRAVGRRAVLRLERAETELWCRVDPRHVERMLTNLVVNAADAVEESGSSAGRITIRLERATLASPHRALPEDVPPGAYVCIGIEDNGGGIGPGRLPRIFEPYFTTKPAGRGTGLGLASVYGMVRQNEGHVSVSELPTGTQFTLWFPCIDPAPVVATPAQVAARAAEKPMSRFDHPIMIVEDIDQVRETAERILSSAGFRTLVASQGQEALDLLDAGFDVRLILSDLEMPVMGGRELAERVQSRDNPPSIIFMTGYSEDNQSGNNELGHMLLAKPFTPERLVKFVKRALEIIDPH